MRKGQGMINLVSQLNDSPSSAEQIAFFVESLAREYYADGPDRRSEPRYKMTIPLVAQPIDDQLQPTGPVFRAVTRDISAHGIGMLSQDPTRAEFLALQLQLPTSTEIALFVRVLRCEPLGFYYDIGGRFFTGRPRSA
jgi:hypothetical protein